jgi:hypothetical protein
MDIPPELLDQFARGDTVLFAGAGLSIGAGLPGWAGLIRPLARDVGARWPADEADLTTEHLLSAAQHFENQRGRNALVRHLRDALDAVGVQPTPVHRLVASLPVRVIFTTNYDDLVERALREGGRPFHIVVSESELAFSSEERVQVVKLCGDLARPESIVLTQRDFNTYFPTHPRLAERLRGTLEVKTPLFLGYSLRDPFFNQIWDHIGLDFGRLQRWGYAVLFDADELEIDDLHRRSIHLVNLETRGRDRTALLAEWLTALAGPLAVVGGEAESPTEPLRETSRREETPAVPPLPSRQPESTSAPAHLPPSSRVPHGGGDLDYERGLQALSTQLEGTRDQEDFVTLEARLRENLREERLYGSSERVRSDRARIVDSLNRLALNTLGVSFNDLSRR